MDRKKLILIGVGCALAVLVLAVIFLSGPGEPAAPETAGTRPPQQTQPQSVPPTAPQHTEPAQTQPTEPDETAPMTSEPEAPAQTEEPEAPETPGTPESPGREEPEETDPPVEEPPLFPVELEGGMVTVHSLFPFSGVNPDGQNLFGENIAGLQLTNTSEEHMDWAEITAILEDGTALTFRAEDVPPGMTVMAFSPEHATLEDTARCVDVYGYAEFAWDDVLHSDLVQLSVEGTAITVKNVSGTDLTDLNVICHGLLDGSCFGGTTYSYRISSLPAGASTVIHAVDCIFGMAQVVRMELDG